MMTERRPVLELRAEGDRRLVGVAQRYGATAKVIAPGGQRVVESFQPGAFSDYLRSGLETRLTLNHDASLVVASTAGETRARGLLELRDTDKELTLSARLPSGSAFTSVLDIVRRGEMAETSIEFRSLSEDMADGRRRIRQASLPAISVVDRGAYGQAGPVEVRRSGRVLQGRIPYGRKLACQCGPRGCTYAEFERGSFELPEEVLAVHGSYRHPLGSRKRGSLVIEAGPDALEMELALQDLETATELLEAMKAADIYMRPYVHAERAKFEKVQDLAVYQSAPVRAIVVGVTDRAEGLIPATLIEPRRADIPRNSLEPRRRRRIWL